MNNKWDNRFMELAQLIASWSKDKSTKVGCVVVGPDREIRTTGYNGLPRGANDNVPERDERPEKYFWYAHSESNALYNAVRMGVSVKGCTLYCTLLPCMNCALAIVQSGIVEVVVPPLTGRWENDPQWTESHKRSLQLFKETGVEARFIYLDLNSE